MTKKHQQAYCKIKNKFFIPVKISGIIKCPYCGGRLHENIGNLKHTITTL